MYDSSQQIGVSPCCFWAEVPMKRHAEICALNSVKVQGSPHVKYRGFFLDDEQPALSDWIENNFPAVQYGPGFCPCILHDYLRAPSQTARSLLMACSMILNVQCSMFGVDDHLNQILANAYGVAYGHQSHRSPAE